MADVAVQPPARVAFVLIDGIGDVALPELQHRSPLQAAAVPNLDAIAAAGINGLMDPVEPGLACGSDTAHLSLLGYDPRVYYRGRGAFESMGAGIDMQPGDIAFKSNFATVDDATGVVVSRRADRHFEEQGPVLCAALDGIAIPGFPHHRVSVRYATEHRCGVVVRGPGLSGEISGTDPLKDQRPLLAAAALDGSPEAQATAQIVNALSDAIRGVLRAHPVNRERAAQGKGAANCVLLRGCGILIQVPQFRELHGLRAAMVAPTKIIAGLGLSLGIKVVEAPGATGDYRTLLSSKAAAIADALAVPGGEPWGPDGSAGMGAVQPEAAARQAFDFGFLHIKAIDDAGHDKSAPLKLQGLEAADRMIGQLASRLWAAEKAGVATYTLCVTGDHSTPVLYGDHSYEPVPFTICHLAQYVKARGGDHAVSSVSLEPFPLFIAKGGSANGGGDGRVVHSKSQSLGAADGLPEVPEVPDPVLVHNKLEEERRAYAKLAPVAGDSVSCFDELAAARGCLGRFSGCEMMTIIKKFAPVGTV